MAEKLKKSLLYTYGIGDLCFTLLVCMEVYYFNLFLTDYAKFSLSTTGIIVTATGIGDIVFAFVAGVILQRVSLKFAGPYRSWLLIAPPLVVVLFLFQFSKIGTEYIAASIIIIGFLASHLFWNIGFGAIGGLMGSITQDPDESTILSSSRAQGQSAGNLLFSYTGGLMVPFFTMSSLGSVYGFSVTILIFGALMIAGYFYLYKMTATRNAAEIKAASAQTASTDKKSVWEMVMLVFRNPPLLFLMIADIFRNTCLFFILSFAAYYFKNVFGDEAFLKNFMLINGIGTLLGAFAAQWIGPKIGKRHAYGLGCILGGLVYLSVAFIEVNAWSFTIIFSIGAMIACASQAMIGALFVDTSVYGEWKTGKNILGFTMSMIMLPIKFGLLIGRNINIVGLGIIGYVAGAESTPEVSNGISSIMIYTSSITSILAAVIFYLGYRIKEKDVVRMQEEIATR
ncbi:MAG: MFS transporter [Deltaproteobacteria bacterium]|nr:MFS transporter [Deltaproteobacteria bacterium]